MAVSFRFPGPVIWSVCFAVFAPGHELQNLDLPGGESRLLSRELPIADL